LNSSLCDLPYKSYALAHEPGRVSDTAKALLEGLINRLPPSDRPRLRRHCYQLIATNDHSPWSCSRNTRLPPYPLRLFQSRPAHSWRCDSFQRTSSSPPIRPIPPTVTQSPHHTTDYQPSSPPLPLRMSEVVEITKGTRVLTHSSNAIHYRRPNASRSTLRAQIFSF
jgi:hypothetical protein